MLESLLVNPPPFECLSSAAVRSEVDGAMISVAPSTAAADVEVLLPW
ncbi:MAG: hypothetical protein JOZ73_07540 [Solirubrobacterales bacterium]|nr:hypothetical protein [Solirubrobacterales bacterium]